MFRRQSRFAQSNDRDCGIPYWRKTRLNSKMVRIINKQSGKIICGFFIDRMPARVTKGPQGNQRVKHRREDRSQTIATLSDAFEHPALCFLQRAATQWTKRNSIEHLDRK